ncbi:hypothetical protein L2E82_20033 [Cichorium intybus]|uniref:Uncharacterized protein n=1 Tax=Cichorium intybus TaxID=13427 RepID=A0ACB9DSK2_CICIN|nr:hypothetical protein L2E82_20033 [Cichorium intybus]
MPVLTEASRSSIRQEMPFDPFDDEGEWDEGTEDLGAEDLDNISSVGMATQNRNYRGWTDNEENKLVEALVNMVNAGGYKADNGFKSGYLAHLEQVLKESLPESGLSGKPHIESKIKVMKKDWQVVYDILHGSNTSGFGYDSVNKCVTADDTVWDEYLKVHGSAAKWRNKKFRHFEDLCTVFGKDRAQGNKARDFVEMEKEADIEEQTQHLDDDSDDIVASTQTPSNNDKDPLTAGCLILFYLSNLHWPIIPHHVTKKHKDERYILRVSIKLNNFNHRI